MRPDAFITVKIGQYKYLFFVEIHISNNEFNYEKYYDTYRKRKHIHLTQDAYIFPTILIVTDYDIKKDDTLGFVKIDTEFQNFDSAIDKITLD